MKIIIVKIFLIIILAGSNEIFAQEEFYIEWKDQFPKENKEKTKLNKKSISNIIFGKSEEGIIKPVSVYAVNPDTLFILDQGNGSIFSIEKNEIVLPKYIKKKIKRFPSLVDICQIKKNKLLFSDSYNNMVYIIDPINKDIRALDDSLKLNRPTGIVYNSVKDEIWIVETGDHKITVTDINGKIIKTIGNRGNGDAEFNFPTSICTDNNGNIYVLDAMNYRIQLFNSEGEFISSFGEQGDATGYFARPKDIACDTFGNIYITDALYHNIQVFNNSGELLYYYGGQGKENEKFWMPSGIYIDKNNYIYIADMYNSRVQIMQLIEKK